MAKQKTPESPPEIPKPHRHPGFDSDDQPEQPIKDDPKIIPDEGPFETMPPMKK
jgi:hypothetical protein